MHVCRLQTIRIPRSRLIALYIRISRRVVSIVTLCTAALLSRIERLLLFSALPLFNSISVYIGPALWAC